VIVLISKHNIQSIIFSKIEFRAKLILPLERLTVFVTLLINNKTV